MIALTALLADSVPTTTTTVLTLLLSENTSIAYAGLLLLAPVVLALYFPIYWMSRPKASTSSKVVAFGLAALIIWLGNGFSDELGKAVMLLFYLPIVILFVNLARSESKDKQEGES